MNNLTSIDKKIIYNRLYDSNIVIDIDKLDNYIIDKNDFKDLNSMYNFIVSNWNILYIN